MFAYLIGAIGLLCRNSEPFVAKGAVQRIVRPTIFQTWGFRLHTYSIQTWWPIQRLSYEPGMQRLWQHTPHSSDAAYPRRGPMGGGRHRIEQTNNLTNYIVLATCKDELLIQKTTRTQLCSPSTHRISALERVTMSTVLLFLILLTVLERIHPLLGEHMLRCREAPSLVWWTKSPRLYFVQ
jgi:hypothetical protein